MDGCSTEFNPQICRFCDDFVTCLIAIRESMSVDHEDDSHSPFEKGLVQAYIYDHLEDEQHVGDSH
jgi:hypothetical protein